MYSDILISNPTLPALVHIVIDTVPTEGLTEVVPISRARIQIDSYANTRESANDLARSVKSGLQKYRGTHDGQFIHEINLATGEVHDYDKDGPYYITTQDFYVSYRDN